MVCGWVDGPSCVNIVIVKMHYSQKATGGPKTVIYGNETKVVLIKTFYTTLLCLQE